MRYGPEDTFRAGRLGIDDWNRVEAGRVRWLAMPGDGRKHPMTNARSAAAGRRSTRVVDGAGDGQAAPKLTGHWLDRGLRRMHDDALREPLPDTLRDLLARRDRQTP